MDTGRLSFLAIGAVLALAAAPALAAGQAEEGKEIAERWCAACHLVSAEQTRASADVPSFMDIAARLGDSDLSALEGFLADPHPVMPQMSLTRQEIRDLVAYIASLR